MGTNFYARIIPKEEDKQKLIDAIRDDRDDLIEDLASEFYGHRNEYTRKGNKIHLGKRSGGWKFLWNPNTIKYCDGYINQETKEYIPVYKYDQVYPLTKQGITDFCSRKDVIITDEYGEQQNPKEFLEMAFNWCIDGLDGKEYQTNPKYNAGTYHPDREREKLWKELGYNPEYYNFYSDGLRFSTSINFS